MLFHSIALDQVSNFHPNQNDTPSVCGDDTLPPYHNPLLNLIYIKKEIPQRSRPCVQYPLSPTAILLRYPHTHTHVYELSVGGLVADADLDYRSKETTHRHICYYQLPTGCDNTARDRYNTHTHTHTPKFEMVMDFSAVTGHIRHFLNRILSREPSKIDANKKSICISS